jgi:hypothetical protein
MITPRIRSLVSLAATLTAALALHGCVSATSRPASAEPAPSSGPPLLAIEFENYARDHVHVYLVGERREWLLGRVEPLAKARLRIPDAALSGDPAFMRLAVLVGQRATLRAADDARATITIAQPAAAILWQRWTFSQSASSGQLAAFGRVGAEVRRP